MNDFLSLAKSRYSVRSFSDKEVEEEKIEKILESARVAPTACNMQPQYIYAIRSKEALETLQKCKTQHFGETLAFLICSDKDACWVRDYDSAKSCETDAAIVATHMMLEAADLGLGSTWIMHFIPQAVKAEFSLPDNLIPVCLLVMGYPSDKAAPSPRHSESKPLSELVKTL